MNAFFCRPVSSRIRQETPSLSNDRRDISRESCRDVKKREVKAPLKLKNERSSATMQLAKK